MPYNSYNDILIAVQEVAEDTSQEFVNFIPKAIAAAEFRLQKELDLQGLSENSTVDTTTGVRTVKKPQGYRVTHNIFLVSSTGQEFLLRHGSSDYLRDYWPTPTDLDRPIYYATDYSFDTYLLAPTPDEVYTLRIDAEVDITPINVASQTNYFTANAGEALFYATMIEQFRFMKHWEQIAQWENAYVNAVNGLNNQGRRDRRSDGSSVGGPSVGENKLLDN